MTCTRYTRQEAFPYCFKDQTLVRFERMMVEVVGWIVNMAAAEERWLKPLFWLELLQLLTAIT